MKTSTKVIIGITVIIGLIAFLGYRKYQKLREMFDKIEIKLVNISSINFTSNAITLNAFIKLINPTNETFDANGFVVKISRINFFYDNKYIATAHPELTNVEVPANNELVISNIPVIIPYKALLNIVPDITNFNQNNISVETIISVGGNEFSIK